MPQKEHTHSKILREAAHRYLAPLGLKQKGRSRTWLDDQVWWLCIVEFQPSGWSRGSYLNVGCMWLWQEKDYLSFDVGDRLENFAPYETPDQFTIIAAKWAARAAREVERYRSLFQTVSEVADYYMKNNPTGFWPNFHASVACGAVGRRSAARQFFAHVFESNDDLDWVKLAQAEAAALSSVLDDTEAFRQMVWDKVTRTRELLKLPKQEDVDFCSDRE